MILVIHQILSSETATRFHATYLHFPRMARLLADNITATINNGDIVDKTDNSLERPKVNVFPYSIFYVFYEQYLTMFEDTMRSLGISIGAVFIVTFILSGFDLMTSIVTILIIIMILVDIGKLIKITHINAYHTYIPRMHLNIMMKDRHFCL